ncbi:MAG: nucleoside:proton symporter [Rhodospirillales bacterium]|nr:nucleoside:proton symporter [Rhodospirillales bacterium]
MIWQSVIGIMVFTGIAWMVSEQRSRVSWKSVAIGLTLQLSLALLLLKVSLFQAGLLSLNNAVTALQDATRAGTSFVFGYIGGGPLPFTEPYPGASFTLAFQALPLILVVSALSAVLFHWRILPAVVRAFAWALGKTLGVSGASGFAVAANIFVGMVEAPLLVRPYISKLTRADLFMVMTAGMATIAGTMIVLYASVLGGAIDNALGHLLTASLISAPAAIMVARLMVPPGGDTGEEGAAGAAPEPEVVVSGHYASTMDAVSRGTTDGVALLINVIAMLVVAVALVSLVNMGLGLLPDVGGAALSLERSLGWLMRPFAWLLGIPWEQAQVAGQLLGLKVVLNEFIAYLELVKIGDNVLDPRSRLILIYALCGFANLGSLGIMIGGLLAIAPERRDDILSLGPKSILSGLIATCLTGAVIGILY